MAKEDEVLKVGLALGAIILISKASAKAQASSAPITQGAQIGQTVAQLYNQAQQAINSGSSGLTIDQIAFAQALLNQIGPYNLAVDGVIGSDTVNAVGNFQTDMGLPDTGVLDSVTYNTLVSQAGYPSSSGTVTTTVNDMWFPLG